MGKKEAGKSDVKKVVILGSGIAGCTAAIYTARANLQPLILSGPEDGGQLMLTTAVENFPGFPQGVQGPELVDLSKKQAVRFGARFETEIVQVIKKIKQGFELTLIGGKNVVTQAVIIATGASARWLGIPSEQRFKGRGLTTCATCDGAFFKGKEVIVVGGGDSAMEESLFLTKFARKITIVHRRDSFRASKIMQERVLKNSKIKVLWNKEVVEIVGDKFVKGVKLRDTETKKMSDFTCDGIFLAIGHVPNTSFVQGLVDLDEMGYIKADRFSHTTIPGIFAAGDVQDIRFRQAITAAGSGCMAAMEAEKYLTHNQE